MPTRNGPERFGHLGKRIRGGWAGRQAVRRALPASAAAMRKALVCFAAARTALGHLAQSLPPAWHSHLGLRLQGCFTISPDEGHLARYIAGGSSNLSCGSSCPFRNATSSWEFWSTSSLPHCCQPGRRKRANISKNGPGLQASMRS